MLSAMSRCLKMSASVPPYSDASTMELMANSTCCNEREPSSGRRITALLNA